MVTKETLKQLIFEDWNDAPQSQICTSILDYLLKGRFKESWHITHAHLRNAVGNYDDAQILAAVQYLCGDKVNLLEIRFELIDESGIYPLDNSEVRYAETTGRLVHPESGQLIDDFDEKVYIYFEPSSLVRQLFKANND